MPNSNSNTYNILVTGSNGQVGSEIKKNLLQITLITFSLQTDQI